MQIERKSGVVEVAKEFDVTINTIGNYVKKGMPYSEAYEGVKKVRRFNIEECKSWVKEQRGK